MSKTFGKYAKAQTQGGRGTQTKTKKPRPTPVQSSPEGQPVQSGAHPQREQLEQAANEMAEMLVGATLGKVKLNVTELSACGAWGLALSMAVKSLMPATLNYLAVTSLAFMVANWGLSAIAPAGAGSRRIRWTLIGAAAMVWFQLRPLMATPEFAEPIFYPSPNAEQVKGAS